MEDPKLKKMIININNYFEFIVCDIWDKKFHMKSYYEVVDYDDYIKRFITLYDLIKNFIKKIEDGEIDISEYTISNEFTFNIYEVKSSLDYYEELISYCYGIWGKDEYNQELIDLYKEHIACLKLFVSKIKIIKIFDSEMLLSKLKKLYLKDYVQKVVGSHLIGFKPISSKYPTVEEFKKIQKIKKEKDFNDCPYRIEYKKIEEKDNDSDGSLYNSEYEDGSSDSDCDEIKEKLWRLEMKIKRFKIKLKNENENENEKKY